MAAIVKAKEDKTLWWGCREESGSDKTFWWGWGRCGGHYGYPYHGYGYGRPYWGGWWW
eukprot:CAMPEP_0184682788 /NCGR_PEP_ID=MMETSP0312-20130426/8749_1 /TAXON_ID=31354 /ORGANISM="Compsopogon coeruleus, Strain SAG 36.94" /LENGTH=57 /DNA_ID=CAMNT_0027134693 /DNA_START=159 /DNA_END=332 /DNA_ORIENTATION=+